MNAFEDVTSRFMDRYQHHHGMLQVELEETHNLLARLSGYPGNHVFLIQTRQKRNRIENALLRFQAGTYGICLLCGLVIDTKRLDALPYAELCLECQQKKEMGSL